MLKLLDTASFYQDSLEQQVQIISDDSAGFEKKAAHEDIQKFISGLEKKPGYTYLHINAMTAGEFHGANRNADFFPEENLKKYFKTFETTPAYVYRSHINKDPARSYGKVIFAIYNERMHRVELIAECPDGLVSDLNGRISMGDFPTTSMACKTPYDTCSICGNQAKSRQEYCIHLTRELGKLYPDGRKVYAINDGPLTFFDISIVVRPADVNSSVLQKVAYSDHVVGSAELAEVEGLIYKKAEFKKWADLIKIINEGNVVSIDKNIENILNHTKDLPIELVEVLSNYDYSSVLAALADLGISPSINFLTELLARTHLGDGYRGIGIIVEEFIHHVNPGETTPLVKFEVEPEVHSSVYSILSNFVSSSSLFPAYVEKRASGVGYIGLGPEIEPTTAEEMAGRNIGQTTPAPSNALGIALGISAMSIASDSHSVHDFLKKYSTLLVSLGAAALLSKYFISSRIEKTMKEHKYSTNDKNNVKIVLMKSAFDYNVVNDLTRASLLKVATITGSASLNNKTNKQDKGEVQSLAYKITKRLLIKPNHPLGAKLNNILKITSFGYNIGDTVKNNI